MSKDLTRISRLNTILSSILHSIRSEATIIKIVTEHPQAIQLFNDKDLSEAVYIAAVTADGLSLQYIKDAKKTVNVALAAVTSNGLALKYINHSLYSPSELAQIQEVAVTNTYFALEFCSDVDDALINLAFTI